MGENAAASTYGVFLGHSGFQIDFPDATLLFDFVDGELQLRADRPLYVFISHLHADHFQPEVFKLGKYVKHAEFFFGFNHEEPGTEEFISGLPEEVQDVLCCFNGEQKLYSDDGKIFVRTLESTDEGVAFLVEINGKKIFHAGDLAHWGKSREFLKKNVPQLAALSDEGFEEIYKKDVAACHRNFWACTERLRGEKIDYAMIPMDPKTGVFAGETVERFHELATIEKWSPMHLWKDFRFADYFANANPELAKKMIGVELTAPGTTSIKPGEKYPLF